MRNSIGVTYLKKKPKNLENLTISKGERCNGEIHTLPWLDGRYVTKRRRGYRTVLLIPLVYFTVFSEINLILTKSMYCSFIL